MISMKTTKPTSPFFKRKIYSKMLEWRRNSDGDSGLLIQGPPGVGKSTLVQKFAKEQYRASIIIDFAEPDSIVRNLFEDHLDDMDFLFNRLSVYYQTPLYPRESLLVLENVEHFPRAYEAMKYLIADGRFDLLETASMLTFQRMGRRFLIPSEVEEFQLNPMDFEEFLWANGNEVTFPYIRQCFESGTPLFEGVHRRMMADFRTYMCVGGMPSAVRQYLKDPTNFDLLDIEKSKIIDGYTQMLNQYDKRFKTSTKAVYEKMPSFLSEPSRTIRYGQIKPGGEYFSLRKTIWALERSFVANLSQNVYDLRANPFLFTIVEQLKVYAADTGLLLTQFCKNGQSASRELYKDLLFNPLSLHQGMFFENAVAQALTAAGHPLYYHTFKKKRADPKKQYEVDFLIEKNGKFCPVELKPSNYQRHASLDMFRAKYHGPRLGEGYVIYGKNLKKEGDITYLPIYMAGLL